MKSMLKVLMVCAMVLAISGLMFAEEAKKEAAPAAAAPACVTVEGKVAVAKDAKGAVTEIKIVGAKETLKVVLNEKGKELVKFDGKEVQVKGTVADKAITVTECKEAAAKAAPAPAPAPAPAAPEKK